MTEPVDTREETWRWDAVAVPAALGVVVALHLHPLSYLLNRWTQFDQAYSHGLFVFGASLFLLYRLLRAERLPVRPSLSGALLAGVTALAVALAGVVNILILQWMGLVVLWWALCLGLLGWRAGWRLFIPIGFVYYAIPFWDYLTGALVALAVVVNDLLLGFRGIHFRVEGVYIHLLDVGIFEIADGCSGLRYLVVALTLATLYSALNYVRVRDWLVLHGVAVLLALLVNWIRIFVIILVGYETEMQSALIDEHELFGWVVFAIALLPFFYVAVRLEHRGDAGATIRKTAPSPTPRVGAGRGLATAGLSLVLVVAPGLALGLLAGGAGTPPAPGLPDQIGEAVSIGDPAAPPWRARMHGAYQDQHRAYRLPDQEHPWPRVHALLWYYPEQRQGSELIQYNNSLVDQQEWRVANRSGAGEGGVLLTLERRYGGDRVLVWYRYRLPGRWAQGSLDTKAAMLPAAFRGRRDGALVAVMADCHQADCADARQLLVDRGMGSAVFRHVARTMEHESPGSAR
ncbi:MAG: EpsI family protein [Ectothiorhodospiraceae bacterium]|nr:EpsI family protein [Ectothiorhodospiraceae bacterium]